MKKSIKILISVIILIFGIIACDCTYGLIFGGEYGLLAYIISALFGLILSAFSVLIIFGKKNIKTRTAIDAFISIILIFFILCMLVYKPLNEISGTNEYVEKQVEIVEMYGGGRHLDFIEPTFYVTVKDKNGKEFVIEEYNSMIDYDEGDTVIIKEYVGGFELKYYEFETMQS